MCVEKIKTSPKTEKRPSYIVQISDNKPEQFVDRSGICCLMPLLMGGISD